MNTLDTSNLFKRTQNKGIKTKRGDSTIFQEYRYFQLMNAYKSLFITNVLNIDEIETEINTKPASHDYYKKAFSIWKYTDKNDLFLKIVGKICDNYGLIYDPNKPKEDIQKINYLHHKYHKDASVRDFLRMHKFETELRRILLAAVLEIEEKIKNTFCNTLNNEKKPANYLLNLNNYNLSSYDSIESLQKNVGKTGNIYSKPMVRKKEQKLIPPYWHIINDMTLGETIKTISNLDTKDKIKISMNIATMFSGKTNLTEKDVDGFTNIVKDIGQFRNTLAHNQPIFDYNVSDCDLAKFPKVSYRKPTADTPKKKRTKVLSVLANLEFFFGKDSFTSNVNANLDLSYMIYVINKIMHKINGENSFSKDISNVFSKYGLFNTKAIYEEKDPFKTNTTLQNILDIINQLDENLLSDIISDIESGKAYKRKLMTLNNQIKRAKKVVNRDVQQLRFSQVHSKYKPFFFIKRYTIYTGIDSKFLSSL